MSKHVWKKWKEIGSLRADVWLQLGALPHRSKDEYPAAAIMKDGTHHDCVLFFEEGSYAQETWVPKIGLFRVYYRLAADFIRNRMLDPGLVSSVSQSTIRTPLEIEKMMRETPSYSMGSEGLVTIHLSDGTRARYDGPFYEFLVLPQGYSVKDIVRISTPDPEEKISFQAPEVKPMLCMFRRPQD